MYLYVCIKSLSKVVSVETEQREVEAAEQHQSSTRAKKKKKKRSTWLAAGIPMSTSHFSCTSLHCMNYITDSNTHNCAKYITIIKKKCVNSRQCMPASVFLFPLSLFACDAEQPRYPGTGWMVRLILSHSAPRACCLDRGGATERKRGWDGRCCLDMLEASPPRTLARNYIIC